MLASNPASMVNHISPRRGKTLRVGVLGKCSSRSHAGRGDAARHRLKKMVTPGARREAVAHLRAEHEVSERRASRVIGADRSAIRYRRKRDGDGEVRARLRALSADRRRFGCRRLHILLGREGVRINHKKLRRLYAEQRLLVRRRGGRKRALGTRAPMTLPQGANQR